MATETGLNVFIGQDETRSRLILAAARAILYGVAARLLAAPPTRHLLQNIWARMYGMPRLPDRIQPAFELFKSALQRTLESDQVLRVAWNDFELLFERPSSQCRLEPYASHYAEPKRKQKHGTPRCLLRANKPCPFSDWYCVHRLDSPCDHISCSLEIASRLWEDLSRSRTIEEIKLSVARQRRFAKEHLESWTETISNAVLQNAHTELYQTTAHLVLVMIEQERGTQG